MSDLFNIPDKDQCGVYTITNRRTGKKYLEKKYLNDET